VETKLYRCEIIDVQPFSREDTFRISYHDPNGSLRKTLINEGGWPNMFWPPIEGDVIEVEEIVKVKMLETYEGLVPV
jgi:hypothetical protein